MSFTHIQGTSNRGTVSPVTLTLGAAPTVGNLVCLGVTVFGSSSTTNPTVLDGNSNAYKAAANTPTTFSVTAGQIWLFYLLRAPSNASATINVSWSTGTPNLQTWADEFSMSQGSAVFDKAVVSANPDGPNTTISTPTISVATVSELLYATGNTASNITAPAANATLGSWTGSGGGIQGGNMSEYALNQSASLATQFTQDSNVQWNCAAMAFSNPPVYILGHT